MCTLLSLGLVYCVYKSSDLPNDVVKLKLRQKKCFLNLILGLLGLLVEFDAIFTAVIRISGKECSTRGRIADFITLGVLPAIYAIVFSGAGIKF